MPAVRGLCLRIACAVAGLVAAGGAFAQETIPGDAIELAGAPPPPYAEGHRWLRGGLSEPVYGVVESDRALVVLKADGTVLRGGPAGWRVSLPLTVESGPDLSDEESLLLEVEASVEDFSDPVDTPDDPDTIVDVDVSDALEAGLLDAVEWVGADGAPLARGVWSLPGGRVIVSRADGVWSSVDGGRRFTPQSMLPAVHAIAALPGPTFVAATVEGIRHSADGDLWLQVESPLDGHVVYDLAQLGDAVLAATDVGLFRSADGLRWEPLEPEGYEGQPIFAIAPDPFWPGGAWLALAERVVRTDDGGLTLRADSRVPLYGVRSLRAPTLPGRVLAAGDDGVWESADGGVTWKPLAEGLPGPKQRQILLREDGTTWLAGAYGVWRVERVLGPLAPAGGAGAQAPEVLPPLGVIVDATLRRAGVSYDPLLIQRRLIRSLYTPRVDVRAQLQRERQRLSNFPAILTSDTDREVVVYELRLCFGRCGATDGQVSFDDPDAASFGEGDIFVVGDEAFSGADQGNIAASAANVSERLATQRKAAADAVADLYVTRRRLVDERAGVRDLPLRDQVLHEIDILEATARLDAWSDGLFSRTLLAGSPGTEP